MAIYIAVTTYTSHVVNVRLFLVSKVISTEWEVLLCGSPCDWFHVHSIFPFKPVQGIFSVMFLEPERPRIGPVRGIRKHKIASGALNNCNDRIDDEQPS